MLDGDDEIGYLTEEADRVEDREDIILCRNPIVCLKFPPENVNEGRDPTVSER